MSTRLPLWFPFEPIQRAVEVRAARAQHKKGSVTDAWGIEPYFKTIDPALARLYHRAKKAKRLSWLAVDKLCCALGLHPAVVYGFEWTALELCRETPQSQRLAEQEEAA